MCVCPRLPTTLRVGTLSELASVRVTLTSSPREREKKMSHLPPSRSRDGLLDGLGSTGPEQSSRRDAGGTFSELRGHGPAQVL